MTELPPSPGLYGLARRILRVLFFVYHRLSVRGLENIPRTGGCIMAANHVSFLDPPTIGTSIPFRDVRFMARDTLFRPDWFGRLLYRLGVVPISRDRGDVGALRKGIQLLQAGECVALFPEGTRSLDGKLQPAKGGIGFLIAKASVAVVPTYIDGTFKAYPKSARWIRPSKIRITFGPPITHEELEAFGKERDAYDKIGELVMARIAAIHDANASQ